jgi:pimeloyl-ACP methyl ester carboxylesterase
MTDYKSGTILINGINIYYEIHGIGEPLLLIEGFGYSSWMWYKQIPELSKHYQVIAFDNRGVGRTDKPDCEYSMELLAHDAASLLSALGVDAAHVLGVSMGGFIAQELALRHPEKVKSLILASTSMGEGNTLNRNSKLLNGYLKLWGLLPGMVDINGEAKISAPTHNYGLSQEDRILYGLSLSMSKEYFRDHPEEIDSIVKQRLENAQPGYAWKRQFTAGINFDSTERAQEIAAPALIITGSQDNIVSSESSIRLADAILGSKIKVVLGGGHLLFIERSDEFNELALGFLDEVSSESVAGAKEPGLLKRLLSLPSSIINHKPASNRGPYKIKKGF